MIKEYNFTVDFIEGVFESDRTLEFTQGDNNTHKFIFNFENEIEDGTSVLLRMYTDQLYEVTIGVNNNKAEYILPSTILNTADKMKISLVYIGDNEEVLTNQVIKKGIRIKQGLGANIEVTSEEISTVLSLIAYVNSNETARQSAESERATAETSRENAESNRATAETLRQTAEQNRVIAENTRIANENARQTAEQQREGRISTLESDVSTAKNDITNIKAEQITQNTNISNLNTNKADRTELPTKTSDITNDSGFITKDVNNLTYYTLTTETGSQIVLAIDNDYKLTAILKDKNGNIVHTSNVIDLPLETMVVNATYNNNTKKIILTLQNGNTIEFSVADLVQGLVSTTQLNTILANYYTETEIDEIISAIQTEQTTQNNAIQTNADNIADLQERCEDLENNSLTDTATGTDITISDSADMKFKKAPVPKGNIFQQIYTGKNLFDSDRLIPLMITNSNISNYLSYDSSTKTLTMTNNSEDTYLPLIYRDAPNINTINIDVKQNTDYVLSFDVEQSAINTMKNTVMGLNNSNQYSYLTSGNAFVSSNIVQFNSGSYTKVAIRLGSTAPVGTVTHIKNIQLEEGSTATSYEPYVGGSASPNPDYPQDVVSAGENETAVYNKNLFDKNTMVSNSGLDVATGDLSSNNNLRTIYIPVEANTTYTIQKITSNRFNMGFSSDNNLNLPKHLTDSSSLSTSLTNYTFTAPDNAKYVFITISKITEDTTDINDLLDSIQIEEGSTATSYEPHYSGSINTVVSNKNLLLNHNISTTINGITFTIKEDGSIKVTGTATNTAIYNLIEEQATYSKPRLKAGTYTLSGCPSGGNINTYKLDVMLGSYRDDTGNGKTFTLSELAQITYARILVYSGVTIDKIFRPQLEQSSTATPYVPHAHQTYTLPVQQPMRKIGDYADDFVKQNGVWYERHYNAMYICDGTEVFNLQNNGKRIYIRQSNNSDKFEKPINYYDINGLILCNKLTKKTPDDTWAGVTGISYDYNRNDGYEGFNISNSALSTDQEYREWLVGLKICYILKEPTRLPCTQAQVTVLEQIQKARTYLGTTHIYSTDTVSPNYEVEYYKDIHTLEDRMDTLEARIELLES